MVLPLTTNEKQCRIPTDVPVNQPRLHSQQKKTCGTAFPDSSVLQIFQAQKKFPGAVGAQVASSNQVLTSMGWGVQRGGGVVGGGWCQASQVRPPGAMHVTAMRGKAARAVAENQRCGPAQGRNSVADERCLSADCGCTKCFLGPCIPRPVVGPPRPTHRGACTPRSNRSSPPQPDVQGYCKRVEASCSLKHNCHQQRQPSQA